MEWLDSHYFQLARIAAKTGKCCRRQVGAVLVCRNGAVHTGANGSVVGDCKDGACRRCGDESLGLRHDVCQCAHAEEVVIIKALKVGSDTTGSKMYLTLQPCFPCLRLMILAGVSSFIFETPVDFPGSFGEDFKSIVKGANMHYEQW